MTAGADAMALKRGIDKAVAVVIGQLKKDSKPISGKKEIAQVASISANNDEAIGGLIADAMEKVGKDGVITVEEAKSINTNLEVVEGNAIRPRLCFALFCYQCRNHGNGA